MAYTPTVWKNGEAPALSAENLNKMEQGIKDAAAAANKALNLDPLGKWKLAGKITKIQNLTPDSASENNAEFTTIIDYGDNGGNLQEINGILFVVNSMPNVYNSNTFWGRFRMDSDAGEIYRSFYPFNLNSTVGDTSFLVGQMFYSQKLRVGKLSNGNICAYFSDGTNTGYELYWKGKLNKLSVYINGLESDVDIDVYIQTTE